MKSLAFARDRSRSLSGISCRRRPRKKLPVGPGVTGATRWSCCRLRVLIDYRRAVAPCRGIMAVTVISLKSARSGVVEPITRVGSVVAIVACVVITSATAAASKRHSRLNQANCRKCEQDYKRFPHRAFSIGTISFPRIRRFLQRNYSAIEGRSRSTDCEPRLVDQCPGAATKDSKAELPGLVAELVGNEVQTVQEVIFCVPTSTRRPVLARADRKLILMDNGSIRCSTPSRKTRPWKSAAPACRPMRTRSALAPSS